MRDIKNLIKSLGEAEDRLWVKLVYDDTEIDTREITRMLNDVIPADYDKSKFKIFLTTDHKNYK